MTTAVIYGSPAGYSTLFGNTSGDDQLIAFGYGNTILSGGANDQIYTGDGTALVELGGFNTVTDSVNLTGAFNEVFAGPETDSSLTISGGNGNNLVEISNQAGAYNTAYNNVTLGGAYNTIGMNGNAFDNVVAGSSNADVLIGFAGDKFYSWMPQVALAGTGNTVLGGDESFNISGAQGVSTIKLGNGSNRVEVAGARNVISLGWNDNVVTALSGHTDITVNGNNPLYPAVNYTDTITLGGTNNIVVSLTNAELTADGASAAVKAAAATAEGDENFVINGGSGNSSYYLGNGVLTIATTGTMNTIVGGNGNGDSVTAPGADNTITLGNGNGDVVTAGGGADVITVGTGKGDTVTANGTGDTITDGSTASTLTANGNDDTITFTGFGTLSATGSGDTITATPGAGNADKISIGDNSFLTLTGGTGSSIASMGMSNTVILAGSASTEVNDEATGGDLELAIKGSGGTYSGKVVLDGFGSDPTAKIDLVGLSGLTSYGAVLAATTSDGLGGVNIALAGGGTLNLTHIIGGLSASEFTFNQPTTVHI